MPAGSFNLMKKLILILFLVLAAIILSVYSLLGCDTWIALRDATAGGRILFAKNSDRVIFDSQPLTLHPRRRFAEGARIDLGRVSLPQVAETYATLGSGPYWCWGYEEGINEFGVVIGNEGVQTKPLLENIAAAKTGQGPKLGPTGMDLLRLGLERGKTAREALAVISRLIEEYGQFGSGLPTQGLDGAYDNSFLIADPVEAWVLDSAGRHWTARQIETGVVSISNALSLTASDRISAEALREAEGNGWWTSAPGTPFDFAKAFGADTPASLTGQKRAAIRAACSLGLLKEHLGAVDEFQMMRIARDRSTNPSLDLDVTASSCVVSLPKTPDEPPVFWWAASVPSSGIFIPFFVHGSKLPDGISEAGTFGKRIVPPDQAKPDSFTEGSFWWLCRDLAHRVNIDRDNRLAVVRPVFDALEKEFAAGLPAILKTAGDLRSKGRTEEAAVVLDRYSADCAAKARAKIQEFRTAFEAADAGRPDASTAAGLYVANFGTFTNADFTVAEKGGVLFLHIPGTPLLELKPPDENGIWKIAANPRAGVSFVRDDKGRVMGMKFHQGTVLLDLPRKGFAPTAFSPHRGVGDFNRRPSEMSSL
jgi:secernin